LIDEDYKIGWRQHFPTYKFEDRDIAIEEYKVAAKNLESEERVFLNASNITLVSSAALGSIIVSGSDELSVSLEGVVSAGTVFTVLMAIAAIFSIISLKYFADRQRAIQFSARKLVVLRRMLGMSYGEIQLILPNWRVEGADQPYALRLFPGWSSYVAYPFWIIAIVSSSVTFFLLAYTAKSIPGFISGFQIFFLLAIWIVFITFVYRSSLYDANESARLLLYKLVSKLLNLPLAENFEYIIYRAKLAIYENSRIKLDTTNAIAMVKFIEDKRYPNLQGIDYKALIRAIGSLFGFGRSSGGSTVHQQLIRTLFIRDLKKPIRRKIVELGLSPWLCTVFNERDLLEVYLASVRFERKVFGIAAAMKYYWNDIEKSPSNAQAFFLIERISNIKSGLLVRKIAQTAINAKDQGVITAADLGDIFFLYSKAVEDGLILASGEQVSRLRSILAPEK